MSVQTIEVKYTCNLCGVLDAPVPARAREAGEDVVAWMEGVVIAMIAVDHSARSPLCVATKITDIKIPIAGVAYIGAPVEN